MDQPVSNQLTSRTDRNRDFRNLEGKVFLLGIGAQKAGSTWLYYNLAQHDDIRVSPIKELEFFTRTFHPDMLHFLTAHENSIKEQLTGALSAGTANLDELSACVDWLRMGSDPFAYLEYFDRLATKRAKVIGELSTGYATLDTPAFKAARQYLKDAGAKPKVVFVMRDPVDRFWSACRFMQQHFMQSLSLDEVYENALTDPRFLRRSRYERTITNLKEVFGEYEVCYLFYEHLTKGGSQEALWRFLDVPPIATPVTEKVNQSAQFRLSSDRKKKLRDMLAPTYEFVENNFTAPPDEWLWKC